MPTTTPRPFARGGATAPRRTPTRSTPRARPSIRRKPQPQSKGQQVLKALTSAVPTGKAAGKARSAAGKPPKGLLILGAAGGLAAALKKRQSAKSQAAGTVTPAEPVPAPSVTSVPEPSPVEVRADGTL